MSLKFPPATFAIVIGGTEKKLRVRSIRAFGGEKQFIRWRRQKSVKSSKPDISTRYILVGERRGRSVAQYCGRRATLVVRLKYGEEKRYSGRFTEKPGVFLPDQQ